MGLCALQHVIAVARLHQEAFTKQTYMLLCWTCFACSKVYASHASASQASTYAKLGTASCWHPRGTSSCFLHTCGSGAFIATPATSQSNNQTAWCCPGGQCADVAAQSACLLRHGP